ncbi:acetyl-CoA carboxylase [Sinorhizobium sp. NFACC03]|uniref:acetyl-CoA carboxylase n=1 Tax=Sinorhizobium sp. NFACC03 TaxID=1566295 RepID=UPI0008806D32|nr:acetyl-CoA carboxylase [Sinorhizobium sp. NFACC03]SDA87798.1 Biotin-requiring enzyme [Sinorhizobium sp. NFACC03]
MSKHEIRSPLPGTFYRSSAPDVPPFKSDGDAVASNEAIGLIEVMKTFQEIQAGVTGSIRFLVDNEEPVMAGQVIAEVEL